MLLLFVHSKSLIQQADLGSSYLHDLVPNQIGGSIIMSRNTSVKTNLTVVEIFIMGSYRVGYVE